MADSAKPWAPSDLYRSVKQREYDPADAVNIADFEKEGREGEPLGVFIRRRISEKRAARLGGIAP